MNDEQQQSTTRVFDEKERNVKCEYTFKGVLVFTAAIH
jgi:hypothetical protein